MNRFQGDPKIQITPDGATLVFRGGQPVMDGGIENVILILLFTKPGWVGNILFNDPNQRIGSDFEEKLALPVTNSNLVLAEEAGQKALKVMVDTGLASRTSVQVSNPVADHKEILVKINYPGGDLDTFLITQNGINWVNQKLDPAYKRV